jgi:hypothetical protein
MVSKSDYRQTIVDDTSKSTTIIEALIMFPRFLAYCRYKRGIVEQPKRGEKKEKANNDRGYF